MRTHKRVLLLVTGLAVFVTAYVVYAHFLGLGRIDGLPPLPGEFGKLDGPPDDAPRPAMENVADQRLRQAFGEECPELKRALKLEVRKRGAVVAADQFTIEQDGRVKVQPFSVAMFGKPKGPAQKPEINTIRSDVAYLTFDRPIATPMDINNCNLIGAELVQDRENAQDSERLGYVGGVLIVNNRATPQRDDDLSMFTPGPVYYQESLMRIWTREVVKLTDLQSKPQPTIVTATGMDLYLETDKSPNAANRPARPPQPPLVKGRNTPNITGVERVVLRADVDMYLWVDAKTGFLGTGTSSKGAKAKPADGKPAAPEKAQVVIKTQGPFEYIVATDFARFDVSQHPGPHPNHVTVTRQQVPGGPCDQLVCDHLELQFRRKQAEKKEGPATPTPGISERSADLEIEQAHATGNQVILTSDSEVLTAMGNDLVYNAVTRQSIIKGDPEMVAMKDGNEIYARQLILSGMGEKDGQQATARGPGRIELRDPKTGRRTLHALWKDTLVSSKEGTLDVLTLTGDAAFEDKENGQQLHAEVLKVWLEPDEKKSPPPAGSAARDSSAAEQSRRVRPHHLDARGKVTARSPEMNIQDCERLVVWFKEAPAEPAQLPVALPPASPATPSQPRAQAAAAPGPDTSHVVQKPPSPEPPAGSAIIPPLPAAAESGTAASSRPRRPIDLSARFVEAFVVRLPGKNDLDKLWCEGAVRVRQDPGSPSDKEVDIRGNTLQLNHSPEGNVLLVTGDLAEVHLDRLSILGPEVNIDQKENRVWVNGTGAMRLPSNTTFQGEKRKQPTELTIHWNRNMFFNGSDAQFYGGIQAEQDNARLACQTMQAFLDRPVSLKEGDRGKQPARVEKLVCDKNVRIEDTQRENSGKLLRYTRIDCREMVSDNPEGVVVAPGPGVVRILQYGTKNEQLSGTRPMGRTPADPNAPKEEELRLTRVNYLGRMFVNNQSRTAIFYDGVEVVNVPTDNPDLPIDVDRLPPGGLYLRCEQLKVYSRKDGNGKMTQEMEAHRKAVVQSREFWGRADVIKFDESKDQVIFEATGSNQATLYRVKELGQEPDEIKGKKITFWRRTNDFKVESGTSLQGTN